MTLIVKQNSPLAEKTFAFKSVSIIELSISKKAVFDL